MHRSLLLGTRTLLGSWPYYWEQGFQVLDLTTSCSFGARGTSFQVENAVGNDMDRTSPPKPFTGHIPRAQSVILMQRVFLSAHTL